jgi:hypothetical protein
LSLLTFTVGRLKASGGGGRAWSIQGGARGGGRRQGGGPTWQGAEEEEEEERREMGGVGMGTGPREGRRGREEDLLNLLL